MDRIADQNLERVLCFDVETGKELWKHEYEARYTISYPLGPRATLEIHSAIGDVLAATDEILRAD